MNHRTQVRLSVVFSVILFSLCMDCNAQSPSGSPVATPAIVTRAVNAAAASDWKSIRPLMTSQIASLVTPSTAEQVTALFVALGPVQSITTFSQPSDPGTQSYTFAVHLEKGAIDGSLTMDGSGSISGLEFHPGASNAEPDQSRYATKGDVHLPFHGTWYALWGGTDPSTNQPHMQAGGSQR